MSVQSELDRIEQNIANTYAALAALGADLPAVQNSDNLALTAGTAKAVLYSPQNLTEAQKAQARENIGIPTDEEIVQQVIAALGTPVFGTVDENNVVTLKGNFAGGTYQIGYENAEGEWVKIGEISQISVSDVELKWEIGVKIDSSTGAESSDQMYAKSQVFPVENGVKYTAYCTNNNSLGMGVVYYDSNGAFMKRVKLFDPVYYTYGEVYPVDPIEFTPSDVAGAGSFVMRANIPDSGVHSYHELTWFSMTVERG